MTFDEWMVTHRPGYKPSDDSVQDRVLRSCWEAATAAEREACAKVCEQYADDHSGTSNDRHGEEFAAFNCAAAIRARSKVAP